MDSDLKYSKPFSTEISNKRQKWLLKEQKHYGTVIFAKLTIVINISFGIFDVATFQPPNTVRIIEENVDNRIDDVTICLTTISTQTNLRNDINHSYLSSRSIHTRPITAALSIVIFRKCLVIW